MRGDAGRPLRVAVVGQVPPPTGGQTLMTRILLDGTYDGVELVHVPTGFSASLDRMGRASPGKLIRLAGLIREVRALQARRPADVLYHVPAPPALVPVLRDLVFLNAVRPLFARTVFHFHAGGVSGFEPRLPAVLRPAFRRAFRAPDVAIQTSEGAPPDAERLGATVRHVVHNGIPDPGFRPRDPSSSGPPRILYLGLVSEEKGAGLLLDAAGRLAASGVSFALDLAGPIGDAGLRRRAEELDADSSRGGRVRIHGPVEGDAKWALFRRASIYCFPSQHPSETFGVGMLEAMACGVPVVASDRRGAREIIDDGTTGRLFRSGDAEDLAARCAELLAAPDRGSALAAAARRTFEAKFTEAAFRRGMQAVFDELTVTGSERALEGGTT